MDYYLLGVKKDGSLPYRRLPAIAGMTFSEDVDALGRLKLPLIVLLGCHEVLWHCPIRIRANEVEYCINFLGFGGAKKTAAKTASKTTAKAKTTKASKTATSKAKTTRAKKAVDNDAPPDDNAPPLSAYDDEPPF